MPIAPIHLISCLISDELTRRSDRLLERRRKQAGFRDANRALDSFDFTFNPKMNRSLIFDLAACGFIGKREDALFLGPGGTGKSHLAQRAIGQSADGPALDMEPSTAKLMCCSMNWSTHADGTASSTCELPHQRWLLIIDDFRNA